MATTHTPVQEVTLTQLHRDTGRLINQHLDGGKLAVLDRYGRIIAVLVVGPGARDLITEPAAAI
jgi:hypothetical protein